MVEHLRSLYAIDDFIVLPASNTANVGRDSGVDDNVFFGTVLVRLKTSKDKESAPRLKFSSIFPESGGEGWEWECTLIDMANWLI